MGGMEVEVRPEAEAGAEEEAEQASRWTADVLSFSFVFSLIFPVSGGYGRKEIREPRFDSHIVGDRIRSKAEKRSAAATAFGPHAAGYKIKEYNPLHAARRRVGK